MVFVEFERMGFFGFELVKWVRWSEVQKKIFELPLKLEAGGGGGGGRRRWLSG